MLRLWLIRHGETAWSMAGQHTGRTDIPLTPRGETQARLLSRRIADHRFALVLTSPLARARETCRLAGHLEAASTGIRSCATGTRATRSWRSREAIPAWPAPLTPTRRRIRSWPWPASTCRPGPVRL
jgi:probable phosphoglycerate mutase